MRIADKYEKRTILSNAFLFFSKTYILLFLLGTTKISPSLTPYFVFKGSDYIEKAQAGAFKTQAHANVQL